MFDFSYFSVKNCTNVVIFKIVLQDIYLIDYENMWDNLNWMQWVSNILKNTHKTL